MSDQDKFSLKDWFDRAQDSYTAWEDSLWDKLGVVGAWIKRKRSAPVPDWKRVERVWKWIVVFAFVCGMVLAGKYYEFQCNKHIVEEFYPEIACINPGFRCNLTKAGIQELLKLGDNRSIQDLPLLGKSEGIE
jgi:hypothetical protein